MASLLFIRSTLSRVCTVKDCETIREALLGDGNTSEDLKWTLMGQSFGGFCAITYLSFHSTSIKEVFTTGGLAPLVDQPDAVYDALVRKFPVFFVTLISDVMLYQLDRVTKRNVIYYEIYPQGIQRVCPAFPPSSSH